MSSEDDKEEEQREEEAAAIIEAARVYHNYFIPVHQDGRTASEFAGLAPPGWLSSLIAEHRETRLSPSEARIVRDDPMLFSGMLTAEMLTGITGDVGTTKRSKVVLMIMEALEDAHRREELERAERWNGARGGGGTETGPSAAVPADVGMDEGEWEEEEDEDEASPEVVVPFVTVYSTKNKARTRALLQTYREDSSTVSFHGVACKVSLEKDEEDDHMFAAYSSYPVEGGEEAKGRARLGVIRLDGDHVELSSTVEERHRALRGFFLKLVGERDVKVVSVVRDAVLNQTTGELVNPDMGEALSLIEGMTPDEILKEGLIISLASGMITHRAKDGGGNGKKDEVEERRKKDAIDLLPSPPFIRSVLQSYRELVAERPRESKGESLREAIFKNSFEAVKPAREGLDDDEEEEEEQEDDVLIGTLGFETSVALIAFFAILGDLARTDGEKVAAAAIDRISNQRSVKDTHVRELIHYLERFATASRPPTTKKD